MNIKQACLLLRTILPILLAALITLPALFNGFSTDTLYADEDEYIHLNGMQYTYLERGDSQPPGLGYEVKVTIAATDEKGNHLTGEEEYLKEARFALGLDNDELQQWRDLLLLMEEGDKVLVKRDTADDDFVYYTVELSAIITGRETKPYEIPGKTRISTDSGLEYIVISEGSGTKAAPAYTVVFHFTGYLEDKTVFASTYAEGEPVTATLGIDEMIPGWFEGLCLMREGDQMRLILPPELAFGEEGLWNEDQTEKIVPPNSTVIFDIDLLEVR